MFKLPDNREETVVVEHGKTAFKTTVGQLLYEGWQLLPGTSAICGSNRDAVLMVGMWREINAMNVAAPDLVAEAARDAAAAASRTPPVNSTPAASAPAATAPVAPVAAS